MRLLITVLLIFLGLMPSTADEVSIATWNIRFLSDGSRDSTELTQIADIITRYDFVAIQEARDTEVLDRLLQRLSGYCYIASNPVGRGQKEIYAYFYRDDLFSPLGEPYIVVDDSDVFIREPYVAHFRTGTFDFTFVTIHLLYGDSKSDRREELALLDEVLAAVDEANGPEQDVILAGDFNFAADDEGWQLGEYHPVIPPSTPTTITESSSYDNFWIRESATQEYAGLIEVYPFDEAMFSNDDDAASLAVSDHRPVAVAFRNDLTDDDSEGDRATIASLGSSAVEPGVQSSGEIRILRVIAHPTADEAITLENLSGHPVNLGGWVLGDENDPDHYRIPSTHTVPANGTHTFEKSTFGFGINNSGETIYLKSPRDQIVDTWSN